MEASTSDTSQPQPATLRLPTLYLGHGAPPLIEDPLRPGQLAEWAQRRPRPRAILMAAAHWESAPLTLGATTTVPLIYDFYGFPEHYYRASYPPPGAPEQAQR